MYFDVEQQQYIVNKMAEYLQDMMANRHDKLYIYGKITALYILACNFDDMPYSKAKKIANIAQDIIMEG